MIKKKKLFCVKSSKSKRKGYYYNITRSNRYIFGGFDGIGKKLHQKYHLQYININKNDLVIDIGANVGELSNYFSKLTKNIYAFEIEQKAIDCLRLNCSKNIQIKKLAIWNHTGVLNFESLVNEASSSLLKPKKKNKDLNIKKIKAITLDYFFLKNKIKNVRLIKIEAEGGEPEILEGATQVLKKTDYVSIDCGPERYGKTTFKQVFRILKINNFEILKTSANCCLAINKRLNYIDDKNIKFYS